MPCERCKEIHEAQKSGLTNLQCTCTCHKDHVCPTQPNWISPIWVVPTTPCPTIPYYGYTWCGTNTGNTFSITAANACAAPTTFSIKNHTACGSGCNHT